MVMANMPKRQGHLTDLATNFGYSFASTATIDLKLTPGDAFDSPNQVSFTACHFVALDAKWLLT